jgi:hypothetical protein
MELQLKPMISSLNLNWSQQSLVVELLNGIENLQLAALQGGVSINTTPGQRNY